MHPIDPSGPKIGTFDTLVKVVEYLRSPNGCPWDLEQTHESLKRNLVEECYEVLEAIDAQDHKMLSEELGDLLVQVAFHTQIASEAGHFSLEDVLAQVNRKLLRRHPHVFADDQVSDAREVERNWERLKRQEGTHSSPVEGIPRELPSLAYAQLMQERASKGGFDWEEISGVLDKVSEEAGELTRAQEPEDRAKELGDLIFSLVNLARWQGIHAEDALRQTNDRFRRRYLVMEALADQRGTEFATLSLQEKEKLWQEAKGKVA